MFRCAWPPPPSSTAAWCWYSWSSGGQATARPGGLAGLGTTAWPFLAGMGIGELATCSCRLRVALVPTGVGVWLSTVAIGMSLRILAGQGTAMVFIAVALAFLGLFLLGWRVIVALVPWLRRRFLSPAS